MSIDVLRELANACEADREEALLVVEGRDGIVLPDESIDDETNSPREAKVSVDMFNIIGKMTIPEKIKLALFGNHSARMILIRDTSSKQIPLFVLQNARITESEIQEIAKNTNVEDGVLRAIASNQHFMKSYAVKFALVSNPKVPVDVSLKWVKFLGDKDLKRLASSKNIPQVLSTHCRKVLEEKKRG